MNSFAASRPRSSWGALCSLFLAVSLLALPGCKKGETTAAPAASGSAATATASGPCANYAAKICEKAGKESATCGSFQTATELMSPAACEAGLKDVEHSFKALATLRGPCDTLVKKLCDSVGAKTEECELVTTQTKNFPPDRCKQMLDQIPEITAQLKRMQTARQPLNPQLASKIATGPVPSIGPENASVQVVEFSDFECPFCSRAADVVHKIREKYGDKVRIVFRQFPLPNHSNAHVAAQASLAANEQGKFWPFHDTLFQNQRALDRAGLEEHAKKNGLDVAAFKKSLDEKKFAAQVDADLKLGEEVSVQGTPTMFVNGKRVDNPTDFEAVAKLIDSALGTSPPG